MLRLLWLLVAVVVLVVLVVLVFEKKCVYLKSGLGRNRKIHYELISFLFENYELISFLFSKMQKVAVFLLLLEKRCVPQIGFWKKHFDISRLVCFSVPPSFEHN